MNERNMQSFFSGYMKKNPPKLSEVYELKFTSGTSIPFNELREHQEKALLAVDNGGLYHRITDQPWIQDRPWTYTLKKPFDCFFVQGHAYVVVWFYKPKKKKRFYAIRIGKFLEMREKSQRKSFTEEMIQIYFDKVFAIT
jgi:hypothetical protein